MFTKEGYYSPSEARMVFFDYYLSLPGSDVPSVKRASRFSNRALALFLSGLSTAEIIMPDGRMITVDNYFLSSVITLQPIEHKYLDVRTGVVRGSSFAFNGIVMKFFENASEKMSRKLRRGKRIDPRILSVCAIGIFSVLLGFSASYFADYFPNVNDSIKLPLSVAAILTAMSLPMVLSRASANRDIGPYRGGHLIIKIHLVDNWLRDFRERSLGTLAPRTGLGLQEPNEDDEFALLLLDEAGCTKAIISEQARRSESGANKITKDEALEKFGRGLSARGFEVAWRMAALERPELKSGGRPKKKTPDTETKTP